MVMSREKVKELLKKRSTKIGSVVLAAAIVFSGSMWAWKDSQSTVPELVVYVDPVDDVAIEDEEVPLAKPKISKSSVKLSVKQSTTLKVTNNKKKVTWSTSNKKVATVSNKGKVTAKGAGSAKITAKVGSKKYTCKVTVVAKTNTKAKASAKTTETVTTTAKGGTGTTAAAAAGARTGESAYITARNQAFSWGRVTPSVASAFNTLGMKYVVNSGVPYDGQFNASNGTLTVKAENGTVYHELGHFVAFLAGNYDRGGKFAGIYSAEKNLYTEHNKAYVCSSAGEYFAESYCQYILANGELKSSRPQTYAAIEEALSMITDSQVNKIKMIYGSLWK